MTLRNMEILFRIRVCQMEYSCFSFLVLWRLGLSIGTSLQRVKVVCSLYDGLVNNRITTISFILMERPEGNRGNLVLHFINFYFFLLLVDSRLCQN